MLDEHTLDLINADIDGELTPEQSQVLDAILEESAEARAMRAEMLKLSNLLESVPERIPPEGLSDRILGQLAPARRFSRFSFSNIISSFQPASAGLAFAAGLLLAVGFYEMSPVSNSSSETAGMVGTMVAGQGSHLNLLGNNLYLSGDAFSGTVSLKENNDLYVLNFNLESDGRQELKIGLDQTGLAYGGFAEAPGESRQAIDSVIISGGTLRVVIQGRQEFAVFLRESNPEQAVVTELITIDISHQEGHQETGGT